MVAISSVVPLIPNINVGENERLSFHTVSVAGGSRFDSSRARNVDPPACYRGTDLMTRSRPIPNQQHTNGAPRKKYRCLTIVQPHLYT